METLNDTNSDTRRVQKKPIAPPRVLKMMRARSGELHRQWAGDNAYASRN